MSVEVIGIPGESNGYGDSMDAFRGAHENTSRIILNLAAGRKKNAPAPIYDPSHPDNQWPVMVYHSANGEKVIGTSLAGLVGAARTQAERENKAALAQAIRDGYRQEPYQKPQIAVLDPAAEKQALADRNKELEGKIVAQQDLLAKLQASVEKLLGVK